MTKIDDIRHDAPAELPRICRESSSGSLTASNIRACAAFFAELHEAEEVGDGLDCAPGAIEGRPLRRIKGEVRGWLR